MCQQVSWSGSDCFIRLYLGKNEVALPAPKCEAHNLNQFVYIYIYIYIYIKTHDSESRGQEEAGRTRRTSELFTRSTALKFVNALNKPP